MNLPAVIHTSEYTRAIRTCYAPGPGGWNGSARILHARHKP